MLFESTVVEDVTVTRRKQLVEALRDPRLAEHHKWDFKYVGGPDPSGCGSSGCAIGLAVVIFDDLPVDALVGYDKDCAPIGPVAAGKYFGISAWDSANIFYSDFAYGCDFYDITPLMVADALEATYANG